MALTIKTRTDGVLYDYEIRVLASGACSGILPCWHVVENGAGVLHYDTSGAALFSRHTFRDADQALGFLYEAALLMGEAEDYLLNADFLAAGESCVFVRLKSGKPAFAYGMGGCSARELFREMLARFRGMDEAAGLSAAAAKLDDAIVAENPDLPQLARMMELARRELICCR